MSKENNFFRTLEQPKTLQESEIKNIYNSLDSNIADVFNWEVFKNALQSVEMPVSQTHPLLTLSNQSPTQQLDVLLGFIQIGRNTPETQRLLKMLGNGFNDNDFQNSLGGQYKNYKQKVKILSFDFKNIFQKEINSTIQNALNEALFITIAQQITTEDNETHPLLGIGNKDPQAQFEAIYNLIQMGCEQNIPEAGRLLLFLKNALNDGDFKNILLDPNNQSEQVQTLWNTEGSNLNDEYTQKLNQPENKPQTENIAAQESLPMSEILNEVNNFLNNFKTQIQEIENTVTDKDSFVYKQYIQCFLADRSDTNNPANYIDRAIKQIQQYGPDTEKEEFYNNIIKGKFRFIIDDISRLYAIKNINYQHNHFPLNMEDEFKKIRVQGSEIDNIFQNLEEMLQKLGIKLIIPELFKDKYNKNKHKTLGSSNLNTWIKFNNGRDANCTLEQFTIRDLHKAGIKIKEFNIKEKPVIYYQAIKPNI